MGVTTVVIAGAGSRGRLTYAPYSKQFPGEMKLVAAAEKIPERLREIRQDYGLSEEQCFSTVEEMFAQPMMADMAFICTQDADHVRHACLALEKGYDLLLEKPVAGDVDECRKLLEKAEELGRSVTVCHVLRYAPFYQKLKCILEQGVLGQIISIQASENVGYWHQAHSFVRGNWRNSGETSPMILQKSCHDMDILRWLAGEPCLRVQSFGSLDYFKAENAPEGAAQRCLDGCACKESCPYDAEKIYVTDPRTGIRGRGAGWPCGVLASDPDEEKIYAALRTGPYGRCVFHCDNNVVDHQTVNLEFAGNLHATFTMTAFTRSCHRTIRITGTRGELEGDMGENKLYLRPFGGEERVIDLNAQKDEISGHGGGDFGLMAAFCKLMAEGGAQSLTGIDASVESHVMALAAEASRLDGGRTITLADF